MSCFHQPVLVKKNTGIRPHPCFNVNFFTFSSAAHVEPKRIEDIHVGRQRNGDEPEVRRIKGEYGAGVLGDQRGPTSDQVMLLQSRLSQATEHLGLYVPAVHVLSRRNFPIQPTPPSPVAPANLADCMLQDDPCLLPVELEEVTSLEVFLFQLP